MQAPTPTTPFLQLPRLYKGVAPGTYWWTQYRSNANTLPTGIASPRRAALIHVLDVEMHIAAYTRNSPLTSVTTSYAVAHEYARLGGVSPTNPGYVFEFDVALAPSNFTPQWFDPIDTLSSNAVAHAHQGDQALLSILAPPPGPGRRSRLLRPVPVAGGGTHPPTHAAAFRALILAARDAELLVVDLPSTCFLTAHTITV